MTKTSSLTPNNTHTSNRPTGSTPDSRNQLRLQMRRARNKLTLRQQAIASEKIKRLLCRNPIIMSRKRVGVYIPSDGEISPQALINELHNKNIECYLPVLHPVRHNRLWFVRYRPGCPMQRNRYGISEPCPKRNPRTPAWALDIVLLPLVAFDTKGGRLGMGGGYYDRTFAFKNRPHKPARPLLLGLAHELQKTEKLTLASWDIPLAGVATDQALYLS